MPDDKTLATILAICDLIKHNGNGVETAVEAYERAMKEVIEYRRSGTSPKLEVGGMRIVGKAWSSPQPPYHSHSACLVTSFAARQPGSCQPPL